MISFSKEYQKIISFSKGHQVLVKTLAIKFKKTYAEIQSKLGTDQTLAKIYSEIQPKVICLKVLILTSMENLFLSASSLLLFPLLLLGFFPIWAFPNFPSIFLSFFLIFCHENFSCSSQQLIKEPFENKAKMKNPFQMKKKTCSYSQILRHKY